MPRFSVRREMSAPEGGHTVARSPARAPMPDSLRGWVYACGALLWLSGCTWLLLHFVFPQTSTFGVLPNPWEPLMLRVHGMIAVAGVFLLGWIASGHLIERWHVPHNRRSGILLAAAVALLVLSGYALYYSTGMLHDVAAGVHEGLGVAALAAALLHWRAGAARRRPVDAP